MSSNIGIPHNIYQQLPKYGDIHVFKSHMEVRKIEDIIRDVLREFCEVSVMGFNRIENYYWCKNVEDKKCILYSEIRIVANDSDSSIIIVINESDLHLKLRGAPKNYKTTKINFLEAIKEGLYLYQNSAFVRYFLQE